MKNFKHIFEKLCLVSALINLMPLCVGCAKANLDFTFFTIPGIRIIHKIFACFIHVLYVRF